MKTIELYGAANLALRATDIMIRVIDGRHPEIRERKIAISGDTNEKMIKITGKYWNDPLLITLYSFSTTFEFVRSGKEWRLKGGSLDHYIGIGERGISPRKPILYRVRFVNNRKDDRHFLHGTVDKIGNQPTDWIRSEIPGIV